MNFNTCTAKLLVQAARAAYGQATIVGRDTDTQVLIQPVNPESVIIAFRGSSSVKDWITDSRFFFTPRYGVRLHDGFSDAWVDVQSQVFDALEQYPGRNVFITGHSLGGALAQLAAWRLYVSGRANIAAVYTFGQPRVGNAQFATDYSFRSALADVTFRFVNGADIVPRSPGVLIGYRHAGNAINITPFGALKNPHLPLLALSDLLDIWEDWSKSKRIALLSDHPIDRYCEQVSLL